MSLGKVCGGFWVCLMLASLGRVGLGDGGVVPCEGVVALVGLGGASGGIVLLRAPFSEGVTNVTGLVSGGKGGVGERSGNCEGDGEKKRWVRESDGHGARE